MHLPRSRRNVADTAMDATSGELNPLMSYTTDYWHSQWSVLRRKKDRSLKNVGQYVLQRRFLRGVIGQWIATDNAHCSSSTIDVTCGSNLQDTRYECELKVSRYLDTSRFVIALPRS